MAKNALIRGGLIPKPFSIGYTPLKGINSKLVVKILN